MLSIHFIGCKINLSYRQVDNMNELLERIKQARIQRGYSQIKIAEILNTTQQQYSKYENGQNEIPIRHIITLCRFYEISADWLLGLKDTMD